MDKIDKSRDLPLSEFYQILQQEFISYYVRSKIYPEPYSEKYREYCRLKREKIEKLALKNALPSIFSKQSVRDKHLNRFFKELGMPNFEYRDEKSLSMMGFYDKMYYFSRGTTVRITFGGEPSTVVVLKNFPKKCTVLVKLDVLEVELKYDEIKRLITDNLVNF